MDTSLLYYIFLSNLIANTLSQNLHSAANKCGCRNLRKCYKDMLKDLADINEVLCIEQSTVGTATIMVFLKALHTYCGEIINVHSEMNTFEVRELYEIELTAVNDTVVDGADDKPVFLIDAGQDASQDGVLMALYIIQQLVACVENEYMLEKVVWVILPNTNPDGLEYERYNPAWIKNTRVFEDQIGLGVDITRNFDIQWDSCERDLNSLAHDYNGPSAASENETIFITNILKKYDKKILAYVSIRGNGHGLFTPYAYDGNKQLLNEDVFKKFMNYLSLKANKKIGNIESFIDSSLYELNAKPHCGHSVDFAQQMGINSVEWRVFFKKQDRYIMKFHSVPKNYHSILRSGYFSLLKEAHNVYTKFDKFKSFFLQDFDKSQSII